LASKEEMKGSVTGDNEEKETPPTHPPTHPAPHEAYLEDAAAASDVLEGRRGGVTGRQLHAHHVAWGEGVKRREREEEEGKKGRISLQG